MSEILSHQPANMPSAESRGGVTAYRKHYATLEIAAPRGHNRHCEAPGGNAMARYLYLITAFLLLTTRPHAATIETVASNLANPSAGLFTGFNQNHLAANSFTTGPTPAILNSATLRLSGQIRPVSFHAFIYGDDSLQPSTLIGEFTNRPITFAERELTFFTNTPLEPNTRYWLAVTTVSGDGGWWQVTGPGTGSWSIGGLTFSADGGATWIREITSRSNRFSLTATILPEPATSIIAALALFTIIGLRRHRSE